ncbi:hypothetical protein MRB53_028694 [Persea americana]|uniref:Uncharacterized protein n=1 Tax=Persea americana TaxID=3435 RepID=A0ACC2KG85_PERAE|nr:hypothetical protein MRB53_028694 [Persea americana]
MILVNEFVAEKKQPEAWLSLRRRQLFAGTVQVQSNSDQFQPAFCSSSLFCSRNESKDESSIKALLQSGYSHEQHP